MAQLAVKFGVFVVEAPGIGLRYEWLSVIALGVL